MADAPVVTNVMLDPGVTASGEFIVVVQGTDFGDDTLILWDGVPQPTTVVSTSDAFTTIGVLASPTSPLVLVAVLSGGMLSNEVPFPFEEEIAALAFLPPREPLPVRIERVNTTMALKGQ